MAKVIQLKKGLNIHLAGQPESMIVQAPVSDYYALVPDDFYGVTPKVVVKQGDKVMAGTPLMIDKNHPEMNFVSPISGEVADVVRGERRKLLYVVVKADMQQDRLSYELPDLETATGQEVKAVLLKAGLFSFIKQRPYDVIANPDDMPRDIFVTAFDTAPLAPNYEFVAGNEEAALNKGIEVLQKLTNGKVYIGVKKGERLNFKQGDVVTFDGPHPAGNVGVQIHHIAPINKGETVWTISALDLLFIGRLFNTGRLDFTRTISVAGSEVKTPCYVRTTLGAGLHSILDGLIKTEEHHQRIISGNVLTGTKVNIDDYLRTPHTQVTVIPEGDDYYDLLGWANPGFNRFSVGRTYFSWLLGRKKEYIFDARLRGGERAIIMSGEYEKLLPMDVLPEFLIKATLAFDIEKMEKLGIYEISPEDFALCEFADTSKLELQAIIRSGLDRLKKEMC